MAARLTAFGWLAFRVLGCAWLIVFGLAFTGQRSMLYLPFGQLASPDAVGLADVEQRMLATPDGAQLVVWRGMAAAGKPTILYFHGNAGKLGHRVDKFSGLLAQGYGLYAMSYRSFSGSTGTPTEVRNIADAMLAYDDVRREGVTAADIILLGESLGTGVALQVAARRAVAGVVLDSPYTSIADIAALRFPYLPVHWAMLDQYDSKAHIAAVHAPILILHGEHDAVVPVSMGRALAQLKPNATQLVVFPDGDHHNVFAVGGLDAIKAWLAALAGRAGVDQSTVRAHKNGPG